MFLPRSLSSSWLLLPALPILLAHRMAFAQPPRCAEDLLCRSRLDRGIELDLARKYEEALREFLAAYHQRKDPRLALNIGRTLHKLGRFAESLSWYKDAGRAAAADGDLQKQLQEFIAEAKQNLPDGLAAQTPVRIVNQPTFAVQTSPVTLTSTATAINNNINVIKLDLGSILPRNQLDQKPLYKRAVLWGPLLTGLTLAAGAVGIAAATWPRPWQPDPKIPDSVFSTLTVGGAK